MTTINIAIHLLIMGTHNHLLVIHCLFLPVIYGMYRFRRICRYRADTTSVLAYMVSDGVSPYLSGSGDPFQNLVAFIRDSMLLWQEQ